MAGKHKGDRPRAAAAAAKRSAEAVRSPAGAAPRQRRALSDVGGQSALRGAAAEATLLARWFAVPEGDDGRAHVHGFHAYPARMHPAIVAAALAGMPGARAVLDPFAGSGTTLVEAALAGRAAAGVDVNPLAVALARVKTWAWTAVELGALATAARAVAVRSQARVADRQRPAPGIAPPATAQWFAPHVRLELAGLIEEVLEAGAKTPAAVADALRLLVSSILVKVSRQRTDASPDQRVDKQIGRGMVTRLFARKADELVARLGAFVRSVPAGTPAPRAALGDARKLSFADADFDLVVTSPPYHGTYDYLEQHAMRMQLLGLGEPRGREMGTRAAGAKGWKFEADMGRALAEMARVLAPAGAALLLVGDSAAGGAAVAADQLIERLAAPAGLRLVAVASQERGVFGAEERAAFAGKQRREHLMWLARA